jgi:hypothetical protein
MRRTRRSTDLLLQVGYAVFYGELGAELGRPPLKFLPKLGSVLSASFVTRTFQTLPWSR